MFPGAGAQVYYNEAGEPLGWDYPSQDDPYEDYEDYESSGHAAADCAAEQAYEAGEFDGTAGEPRNSGYSRDTWTQQCYDEGYFDATHALSTDQEDD